MVAAALLLAAASASCAGQKPNDARAVPVRMLVWVRDARGAPLPGLTAQDFVVSEDGVRDEVEAVGAYLRMPGTAANAANKSSLTHVLVLLAPMSPQGRAAAYSGLLQFLQSPAAQAWSLALVDNAGNYLTYGQSAQGLLAQMRKSRGDYRPHRDGSEWYRNAGHAIRELGLLPGRHAVLFVSDPQGASPMILAGAAVAARAPLYVWRTIGPDTTIPGGSAAAKAYEAPDGHEDMGPIPFVTGEFAPQELNGVLSRLGYLDSMRVDFAAAARESGGLEVHDLRDAFTHIAEDAAGYYVIDFSAHPNERDGTWHPVEIDVRVPHATVAGPRAYMALSEAAAQPIPATIQAALRSASPENALQLTSNGWLFPTAGGIQMGVLAVDINWPRAAGPSPKGTHVQLLAELTSESTQSLAGRWYEELAWPAAGALHWQREAHIYPGAYSMRVVAVDAQTGKTATAVYGFTARPTTSNALRFSALVLSTGCLSVAEEAKARRDLLDPMRVGDCTLAPAATYTFKSHDRPRMMIRIYPPDERFESSILRNWKATAQVDGNGPAVEMEIVAGPVRGLMATGTLPLDALRLKPGAHALQVAFEFKDDAHQARRIPFRSTLAIEPDD